VPFFSLWQSGLSAVRNNGFDAQSAELFLAARAVLDVAKKKVPQAILIQGKAKAIPYKNRAFARIF
jgi:hypothetical protein